MFRIVCIFLLTILIHLAGKAQSLDFQAGSRSMAMGNASVAVSDVWAVFNNIGAMPDNDQVIFGAAYTLHHQLEGLKSAAACISLPLSIFQAGGGVYYFGDAIYNEGKVNVAVSHKINFVRLGAGVSYVQYNAAEFGSRQMLAIEAGGLAELFPNFHVGAYIYNLNQAALSGVNAPAPILLKAGISWRPGEDLTVNLDVEKDTREKPCTRAGLEYAVVRQLLVRTGFSTWPRAGYGGLGFHTKVGEIDYAISGAGKLGLSHQVSVSIPIRKKS